MLIWHVDALADRSPAGSPEKARPAEEVVVDLFYMVQADALADIEWAGSPQAEEEVVDLIHMVQADALAYI